jgi:hypothetical protein
MYIVKLSQAIAPEALPQFAEVTAKVFKTDAERMQRLLSGVGKPLSKPLPKEKAERIAKVLNQLGVTVDISEVPSETDDLPFEPNEVTFETNAVPFAELEQSQVQAAPVAKRSLGKNWPDALLIFALIALLAGVGATLFNTLSRNRLAAQGIPAPIERTPSTTSSPNAQAAETTLVAESQTEGATSSLAELTSESAQIVTGADDSNNAIANEPATAELSQAASTNETATGIAQTDIVQTGIAQTGESSQAVTNEAPNNETSVTSVIEPPSVEVAAIEAPAPEAATQAAVAELPSAEAPAVEASVVEPPASGAESLGAQQLSLRPLSELSAGNYVQVGAYSSPETAALQQQRLEKLGYSPVQAQDYDLLVLLVGPLDSEQLATALKTFKSQAISHYVRNLP